MDILLAVAVMMIVVIKKLSLSLSLSPFSPPAFVGFLPSFWGGLRCCFSVLDISVCWFAVVVAEFFLFLFPLCCMSLLLDLLLFCGAGPLSNNKPFHFS